jgi:hypothetical protein
MFADFFLNFDFGRADGFFIPLLEFQQTLGFLGEFVELLHGRFWVRPSGFGFWPHDTNALATSMPNMFPGVGNGARNTMQAFCLRDFAGSHMDPPSGVSRPCGSVVQSHPAVFCMQENAMCNP